MNCTASTDSEDRSLQTRSCRRSLVLPLGIVLLNFAVPAFAGSLVFSLSPTDPNDALLVSFSLATAQTVTMQSYGFGGSVNAPGGTNAAGAVISPGGFDPYFSLFTGTGPGAVFLTSNDDGSCPPGNDAIWCSDSTLVEPLAAGSYTLAVSVFDNFSFAENNPALYHTLGDGFIGLGSYSFWLDGRPLTSDGAVDILAADLTITNVTRLSDTTAPVPEPESLFFLATTVIGFGVVKRCRKMAGAKEV